MGTPLGTVMSRIHHGRHMLRTKLGAHAPAERHLKVVSQPQADAPQFAEPIAA